MARNALAARFGVHGIAPDRLVLRADGTHLAAYQEIDIALDTFPYNGTTTTCEALWMGVPVVTWLGERRSARVSASLLQATGLSELIGDSVSAFVAIAVELADNLERLETLRATLRERMAASPLCDPVGFARAVETALRDAWRRWCRAG